MTKHIKYIHLGGKLKVSQIKHFLKSSYDKKEDLTDHDGYQVDRDLSGSRFQAYYHPEKEHLVTVHRGTANMADWLTDLRYAFGDKSGRRFKHAKNQQQLAQQKYSNAKQTSILGHSLAHALADHANNDNDNNELITVNGAVNIPDSFKKLKPEAKKYHIKSSTDPISFFARRKTSKIIPAQYYDPLKEHSYDILDRLDENEQIGEGLEAGCCCDEKHVEGKAISYQTYSTYAKKYKIKLTSEGKKKSMKLLSDEIFAYEKSHKIKNGLYF
jgi:hypothetical protein